MQKIYSYFSVTKYALAIALLFSVTAASVYASSTSNFTLTINAGTLSIDIVDTTSSYASVGSPTVAFGAVSVPLVCPGTNATGTLGTATQSIYIQNPDAADNGWTASIAASATTAVWDSTGTDFDFNDPSGSGCTDGADTDSVSGQLTVNPSVASIGEGQYSEVDTGVSLGSSSAFNEGTTDSITIVSATAGSVDVGDWTVQGVSLSNTIPAGQPAAADYDINMVLSIVAL